MMITNTFKILKYKGNRTLAIAALSASLSLLSCSTTWWDRDNSDSLLTDSLDSKEWIEQSNRTALLSLTPDDYLGLSSRGAPLHWQPLLMPLRNGLALTDRLFTLGSVGTLGNIDGRLPELGQCQSLSQLSTPQSPETPNAAPTQSVDMELEDQNGSRHTGNGGQLFLVHDQITRFVRAIGFWDDDGKAACQLPPGRWIVSTGFGEARTHTSFLVTSHRANKIGLRAWPRARLVIRPGKETGLQYGDLMRIGRIRALTPVPQTAEQLPEVPILVQDDLMRATLTPSENQNVREYLFTSLLIQRPEFSISLEPGEYSIGLWRDGVIQRCASKLIVQPSHSAILACDPASALATLNPQNENDNKSSLNVEDPSTKTIVFDASFMPSRLLSQNSFRAWMAKSGVNRFLRAGRSVENQQQLLQFYLQPLLQSLTSERIIKPEGPFNGDFRLSQKIESERGAFRTSFVRLLHAQPGLSLDALLTRVLDVSFASSIPLAGISERGFLDGVVPLTFRTYLKNGAERSLRTEETEAFVSNGAQLEWIDPSPALSGSPIRLGAQQRIRLRLTVPPEDTTEYLTMYVNGESYKQWQVPMSQYKNMIRSLEIDEKVAINNDYHVSFASWGKNYLSEYMFGARQLPAIGFTRLYCVDNNENGVCDRQ